ncbi:hypothetical protein BW737_000900 [Actinomyces ruminis]|uniref:V8-like Glu-specific endopeptidase n=1 Tax=Actinomyces ruminis TaxID=1937003 RepID=A0ABX4ME31_9ACTO|nr:hypothetical protein BW737_000900 [Actinomyces ruminis]
MAVLAVSPAVAATSTSGTAAAPAPGGVAAPSGAAAPVAEDDDAASTAVVAPNSFGQEAVLADEAALDNADAESNQDVIDYWTPERMAQAKPVDVVADPEQLAEAEASVLASAEGEAGATDPVQPSDDVLAQAEAAGVFDEDLQTRTAESDEETLVVAPPVTNFSVTNGKLFFEGYEKNNGYCSASALNTPTRRVIITAGHCVYYQGSWSQNVVFVPAYDGRNADPDPVGIWTARTLRTFNSWINDADLSHDVGVITLNNGGDDNRRIVDAVGGHGLMWNGSKSFDVSIFGYPSNKSNPNGRYSMWACWGATRGDSDRDTVTGCDFGRGSSGGPWLAWYNNSTGLGYVRSVTSTWLDSSDQNWGPYFNTDVKKMVDASNHD